MAGNITSVRDDPPRSHEAVDRRILDRLAKLAAEDRADFFARHARWAPYRERLLCVALCQGAAKHFIDGRNGVKDLDVWSFYAHLPSVGSFPPRRRRELRYGRPPFEHHYVDLMGRSLGESPRADPVAALRRYLEDGRTPSARKLAEKAAVILEPAMIRGTVAWPRGNV